MPRYVIDAPTIPTVPVTGTQAVFPLRRVYCIGRNYAAHSIEMGHDPDREDPFFFQKNPDNVDPSGVFPYPEQSDDVHFELELAVALKSGGRDIGVAEALDHVFGYGLALDMTRRDLQAVAKKAGRPWEIAKAFERSAPITALTPAADCGHPAQGRITLEVNGETRQDGDIGQMIWKIPEIIAYLSGYFDLAAGDLILTGTPAGVGAVRRGDSLVGKLDGLETLSVEVV